MRGCLLSSSKVAIRCRFYFLNTSKLIKFRLNFAHKWRWDKIHISLLKQAPFEWTLEWNANAQHRNEFKGAKCSFKLNCLQTIRIKLAVICWLWAFSDHFMVFVLKANMNFRSQDWLTDTYSFYQSSVSSQLNMFCGTHLYPSAFMWSESRTPNCKHKIV